MVAKPPRSKWKTCTFLPRSLPTVIFVNEDSIIGPFCQHCGAPRTHHSPTGHCPTLSSSLWPTPNCGCHAAANSNEVYPGATLDIWNSKGKHRVTLDGQNKPLEEER